MHLKMHELEWINCDPSPPPLSTATTSVFMRLFFLFVHF